MPCHYVRVRGVEVKTESGWPSGRTQSQWSLERARLGQLMAKLGVAVYDQAGSDVILEDLGNLQALAVEWASLSGPDPYVDGQYLLGCNRRAKPCVGGVGLGGQLACIEPLTAYAPQLATTYLAQPHAGMVPDPCLHINWWPSPTGSESQEVSLWTGF